MVLAKLSRAVPSPQSESFHEDVLQEKHCLDSSKKKGSSRREKKGKATDRSSCGPKAMCVNMPRSVVGHHSQGVLDQSGQSTCLVFLRTT